MPQKPKSTLIKEFFDERQGQSFTKEAKIAAQIVKILNPTQISGTIYFWNDAEKCWKADFNNSMITHINTHYLPEENASHIKNVYTKICLSATPFERKVYLNPTLFMNNKKVEIYFDKQKNIPTWKTEDCPENIFNIFNIENDEMPTNEDKRIFEKLFSAIFSNIEDRKHALALWFTCLIPTNFESCIFQIGSGEDGKTTIHSILNAILGDTLYGNFSLNDESKFAFDNFENKTCIAHADFDGKNFISAETIKTATTNGTISCEKKGKQKVSIQNYATVLVSTNSIPRYKDSSNGVRRRLNFIFFDNSMKKNPEAFLDSTEYPTIFTKSFLKLFIEKALEAFVEKFDFKTRTIPATAENIVRKKDIVFSNDPIFAFLEESDLVEELNAGTECDMKYHYHTAFRTFMANEFSNLTKQWGNRSFYNAIEMSLKNNYDICVNRIQKTINNQRTLNFVKKGITPNGRKTNDGIVLTTADWEFKPTHTK